jgi:DNA-binding Lrp family transcriptional regulator
VPNRLYSIIRISVKTTVTEKIQEKVKKLPSAFVFINTEPASIPEVLKKLRATEGVEGAEMVCGVYDIVAKVKTETMDQLKQIITYKIRRLDKVRETQTLLVIP